MLLNQTVAVKISHATHQVPHGLFLCVNNNEEHTPVPKRSIYVEEGASNYSLAELVSAEQCCIPTCICMRHCFHDKISNCKIEAQNIEQIK